MIVRMWEVRARPEALRDLLTWVCETAIPDVEIHPWHAGSEVFASTDQRVVVVSRWRGGQPLPLADPPRHLVLQPPTWWDFAPVDR